IVLRGELLRPHPAGADHEEGIAQAAFAEDDLPRPEAHEPADPREGHEGVLVSGDVREEGAGQERCAHVGLARFGSVHRGFSWPVFPDEAPPPITMAMAWAGTG